MTQEERGVKKVFTKEGLKKLTRSKISFPKNKCVLLFRCQNFRSLLNRSADLNFLPAIVRPSKILTRKIGRRNSDFGWLICGFYATAILNFFKGLQKHEQSPKKDKV